MRPRLSINSETVPASHPLPDSRHPRTSFSEPSATNISYPTLPSHELGTKFHEGGSPDIYIRKSLRMTRYAVVCSQTWGLWEARGMFCYTAPSAEILTELSSLSVLHPWKPTSQKTKPKFYNSRSKYANHYRHEMQTSDQSSQPFRRNRRVDTLWPPTFGIHTSCKHPSSPHFRVRACKPHAPCHAILYARYIPVSELIHAVANVKLALDKYRLFICLDDTTFNSSVLKAMAGDTVCLALSSLS